MFLVDADSDGSSSSSDDEDLPELGGKASRKRSRRSTGGSPEETNDDQLSPSTAEVHYENGPSVTAVFNCLDTSVKNVVSIFALHSGVSEADFILPDNVDGAMHYDVLFRWPRPMYDMNMNHRDNIDAVPKARIRVNLSNIFSPDRCVQGGQ